MFGIKINKWGWLLIGLVFANIAYYLYNNWGLVTVKVKDEPLSKVVQSIEWQGWVRIYTNLPPDTKVTMYVDHVPLAEAMETLAANVDVPPPADGDGNGRPNRADRTGGFGGTPPPGGTPAVGANAGGPGGQGGGPPGGRGGLGGGGGFGRAQWNLAFFVAPNASQMKQEIREFELGDPDTENKVYTYGTQIQLIANESITAIPDPKLQSWSGTMPVVKPPAPAPTDPQASATTPAPVDPPANTPPTVHTYLEAFAQSANIWIMAPGSWAPEVASVPPANSSIINALKNLVSSTHGVMTEAIILRNGRGGARGGNGDFGNDDAWADRMRNAINGLPPEEKTEALSQLDQEIQFRKEMRALPPEQRRQKFLEHAMERLLYADRSRLSPEKRAKGYQRLIAMRMASKAQK